MATPLLDVRNLNVSFATAGNRDAAEGHSRGRLCHTDVRAVQDVSFSIRAGEVLGLVGESGSGKSVTSLAIMRLLAPQARATGEIFFGESQENLLAVSEEKMRAIRGRQIAMIFQEPMSALNPVMRVGDQIAEAVLAHQSFASHPVAQKPERQGWGNRHHLSRLLLRNRWGNHNLKSEAWRRAVEAMREVAIPEYERRARDYPHQLSGGMRQRVMIAMMLVNRPQLLIADEPTTALDVTIQAQILELLNDLRRKFGLAMLFISHDLGVVSQVAERVAVMYAGRIVETGAVKEVFANPAHPYTRGLMQAVPSLRTERGKPLFTMNQ
ncbi:MAG: Oligopeptide/dipeptide transporter, ATPase subunit [Acidobacteriaceae bacterium]|nr:Oligopeptide/dipeptide transporter, ATPase subunit [Acidobacteriaceae bacterium]